MGENVNNTTNEIKSNRLIMKKRSLLIIFIIFIITSVIINIPSGITSSILDPIKEHYHIENETIAGLIASSTLFGTVIGYVIFILIIEKNFRKTFLVISLVICIVSLIITGLIDNIYVFVSMRFINGLGMAFIAILNPIWVDQFILKEKASICMSLHNLSSIIGSIIGNGLASILINYMSFSKIYLVSTALHIFILIIIILSKKKYFNSKLQREIGDYFIEYDTKINSIINDEKSETKQIDEELITEPLTSGVFLSETEPIIEISDDFKNNFSEIMTCSEKFFILLYNYVSIYIIYSLKNRNFLYFQIVL